MARRLPGCSVSPGDPPKLQALGENIETRQNEIKMARLEYMQLEQFLGKHTHEKDFTSLFELRLVIARLEQKLIPMLIEHESAGFLLAQQRHQEAQEHLQEVESARREEFGLAPGDVLSLTAKQSCPEWVQAYRATVGAPGGNRVQAMIEYGEYLNDEIPDHVRLIEREKERVTHLNDPPKRSPLTSSRVQFHKQEQQASEQNRVRLQRAGVLIS